MDFSSSFNWPGITLFASVVSSAWYFIKKEIQHKQIARFDMAISKIYSAIERYVKTANKVKTNINTMPLKILIVRDAEIMDEWISKSVLELENIAIMTEMFFCRKDRVCFNDIVEAAQDFKASLHKAFSASTESARLNIYDSARVDFNKRYDSGMRKMVDMLHDRILGEWEHDLTKPRVSILRQRQVTQKKNQ